MKGCGHRPWILRGDPQQRERRTLRIDSRLVEGAIKALRGDGRLESAERDVVGFAGDPPPLGIVLFAAAPMDYGQAQPGDGIVQGQKGDLIEVRYTQPDGSVLSDSIVMQ